MDEQQWLACTDPQSMLRFVRRKSSERKLRLYVCAGCRHPKDDPTRDERIMAALDVADHFADGLVKEAEYIASCGPLQQLMEELVSELEFERAAEVRDYRWALMYKNPASARATGIATRMAGPGMACKLLRDIFGLPLFHPIPTDPSWLTLTVKQLAVAVYEQRTFDDLPFLADALEEAGCDNTAILNHCRSGGPHVRGCWPVDLLLR